MMLHPEPVELRVAPETSHRLARIHESLRDLGLEQCSHCQVWKDAAWFQSPPAGAPFDPMTRMICTPCRDASFRGGRP